MGNVFICSKCKRLVANAAQKKCTKCGGDYVSLNIDMDKWNKLSSEEMKAIIARRLAPPKVNAERELKQPDWEDDETDENPSDKWVWALATAPIIASIVLSILGIGGSISTIVLIILNCVFISLDEKELKRTGHDPEKWLWMGLVLVPIYLFVRESKTNRNWAPGIVWCVILLLGLI